MECNSKLLRDILAKRLGIIRHFILCCSYAEVSLSLDALEYGVYLLRIFYVWYHCDCLKISTS